MPAEQPPSWSSGPGPQPGTPAAGAVQPGPIPVGARSLAVVWNEGTKSWEPAAPLPLAGFAEIAVGVPSALVEIVEATPTEPSAAAPAIVTGYAQSTTEAGVELEIKVSGVKILLINHEKVVGPTKIPFSFPVAKGAKWEWVHITGLNQKVFASVTII